MEAQGVVAEKSFLEKIAPINHGLRDYQIEAKEKVYESWQEDNRSVLLQMPTGTGKTMLFCSIVREFNNAVREHNIKGSFLVVAHREELILQIRDNLANQYHVHSGVIKAGYSFEPNKPTQVASIQTLRNRDFNKDVALIIIDEAHHATAETYRTLWDRFPNALIFGVTATPYRMDGSGLHDLFDELIISQPINDFIRRGYLSNVKYFAVPDSKLPDLTKVNTVAGDYNADELMEVVGNDVIIQSKIIDAYRKFVDGKKGIVYTINRDHNQIVKEAYENAGIKAEIVDGTTPPEDRARIIDDFKNNRIKVLCNVDIFTEGFDCPDIDFVQLARPSKSLTKYLQQIGRCMRPAPDKSFGYVLDNVGLHKEHGLFNTEWDWERFFYGEDICDAEGRVNGEPNEEEIETQFVLEEGDEEMMLINTELEIDLTSEVELSLFDFFNELLKERFNVLINLGYAQTQVYAAIRLLHEEDYLESEGVYKEYKDLVDELAETSSKIFDYEQKITELENQQEEADKVGQKKDYKELFKAYDDVLKFYEALLGTFEEEEVIRKIEVLYPAELEKANVAFEKSCKKVASEALGELDSQIQSIKKKLEESRNSEADLKMKILEFVERYNPAQNEEEEEKATEVVIKRTSSEVFSIDEAFESVKKELSKLNTFSIKNAYSNMGGVGSIEKFKSIMKLVEQNRIPDEVERQAIRKLLLKQREKGYELTDPNIIRLLTRRWDKTKQAEANSAEDHDTASGNGTVAEKDKKSKANGASPERYVDTKEEDINAIIRDELQNLREYSKTYLLDKIRKNHYEIVNRCFAVVNANNWLAKFEKDQLHKVLVAQMKEGYELKNSGILELLKRGSRRRPRINDATQISGPKVSNDYNSNIRNSHEKNDLTKKSIDQILIGELKNFLPSVIEEAKDLPYQFKVDQELVQKIIAAIKKGKMITPNDIRRITKLHAEHIKKHNYKPQFKYFKEAIEGYAW